MKCVKCQSDETAVIDSRSADNGKAIRRRRKCEVCQHRFTTFERPEFATFTVVKSSGKKETFSREKLARGIRIAAHKRLPGEEIENLLSSLEERWAANKKEISSRRIGREVMEELRRLDEIAFLRFASVCREFRDAAELLAEIEILAGKKILPPRRKKNSKPKEPAGEGLFSAES